VNNQKVVLDSGFWIALYEPEKEPIKSEIASTIAEVIDESIICIPWPTMFEFVNSRLGRRDTLNQFKRITERPNAFLINDTKYRKAALDGVFNKHLKHYGDISLVNEVIKLMIEDPSLQIDYFVSFDEALCNFAASRGIDISLQL
jgi:predicted nucleic acid-binding protein